MTRFIYLFLLLVAVNPLTVIAQRNPAQKVNISALENKIVIPQWASSTANNFGNTPVQHRIEATCDTILLTRQSQIDSFKILYPGCTSVQLLEVNGQGASPAITQLDSLNEIVSISQNLKISHTSITSLAALSALVSLGDTLELQYNFLQTSIGLNNLISLGDVIINKLPALNSIAGLSNTIDTIGGVLIDSTSLTSLNGLGTVVHMNGYLDLRHSPIVSLSSLTNLRFINGYLRFEFLPSLTSIGLTDLESVYGFLFSGLDNLTSLTGLSDNLTTTNLGTIWMINTGLTSLAGLNNVTGCSNFYFWLNPNLTTLNGFNQVSGDVPGGISLWANDALTDISALSNITSISNGDLDFHGNNQLSNLAGLGNIVTIGRRLRIYENPIITSLAFLNNSLDIQDNNTEGIQIENNPQLSVCSFDPVCNYLNNGGFGVVQNNAPGCTSIAEIQAGCGPGCTSGVLKTWTGTNGTDWNDPDNWSPIGVPGNCDKVYIPSGVPDNPEANGSLSTGGLIMESGSSLEMNGYNLVCKDTVYIDDGDIYNANSIQFNKINDPYIFDASIQANSTITIDKYFGSLYFAYNTFSGNVVLIDSIDRSGLAEISSNQFNNDLTIFGTSQVPGANTFVSSSGDDYISGSFGVAYTSIANLSAGTGGTLHIGGDLNLNTNVNPSLINLNSVNFNGGSNSHIRQFGTVPVSFNNLYTDKFSKAQLIIPEHDIFLRGTACLSGGLIKTSPTALLIAEDNASINCHSSESWVWGPLKKIGDDQFTFAVGDSLKKALLTLATAPAQVNDAFTAQYFQVNPSAAGYDTSLHAASLTAVSGKEYWILNRDNGTSNVKVNLQYDSTRSQQISSIYSLRTSSWNGSQWINNGAFTVSGNLHEAYVVSQDTLSSFGPITLGYVIPPRIPVITITSMDSVVCRGSSFKVHYTVDTLMFPANTFTAQLSDSAGSFNNSLNIGYLISTTNSDSIVAFIPANTVLSSAYRVRVTGTAPPDTSINTKPLHIKTIPSVNFTIEGPATGCINTGIHKYYPSQREAGVNYNWSLSGGGTFTTNEDTAYVTWTTPGVRTITLSTSNQCGNGPSANRNITVSYPAPSAAAIVTKVGRWLYATAPDTGQHATGHQWYRNDTLISGATASSYYASLAGTYNVRYYNLCGEGPASNSFSFAANSIPQTINFPAIPNKTYGDSAFAIVATSISGLPVSLALINGPGTLSGNTYTITTTGTATIRATQQGDDVYDTAAIVIQNIIIDKAAQTISFPVITDQVLGSAPLVLNATASSGLPVGFSLLSGPAALAGNQLTFTGLGTVSITANQNGDTNYLAATSVNRTFCVRVAELATIAGPQFVCPGQSATYRINKVNGLTYSWRLSDGTTYPSIADTVNITWGGAGSYTLIVSATGPCGASTANDSLLINVVTAVTPGAVANMLPADGATDQTLPLNLSWLPGSNALTYDLYIWDSATTQPTTPYAANMTNVSYIIPQGALLYHKTYKWKVVSKNACLQTDGPIQHFRLKKLPDLIVSNVQAPAAAFSGQTITINWRVTNNGPGNTATNQGWTDAVFLSFDTIPNFNITPNTSPAAWNQLEFPVRPLLIATRNNVSSLDSGQHYDNSVNFTLPINYSQPLYAYVITNFPANSSLVQMTVANDTARAANAINVTLSPTPDLRVDTVFTPASVFSGSTINVTYKVKNYGVLTPTGSQWTDKIYISQSPIFNINNAILLKLPRANGTYYPNASDVAILNNTQLLADSSYTKSVQVVIPNFISGQWFIYVHTNSTASLYEGALANNNINNKQLQVFLTPTPQLTINSLAVPVTTAGTTQPVGVNWNILNTGFNDNLEKNKGHYYIASGSCSLPGTAGTGIRLSDSIGFGSSYWIDRVYLSTDPSGINGNAVLVGEKVHGILNSGIGADFAPSIKCVTTGTDPSTENINTSNVVRPGTNHPVVLNFVIPADLQPGNYYVYVRANALQTVFEYPGTPQIRRSTLPITIQRPDATVSVTIPSTANAGQSLTINYNVLNNGPGSVFNAIRKDKIYISNSAVFDGSAQLISTQTFTENLPAGTPVPHSISYTIPPSASGNRYFYVHTNFDSTFRETSYSNNISAPAVTNVLNPTPADLVVTTVPIADSIFTIYNSKIKYTVTNNGPGSTYGNWSDSIFISCNATYNPATSYFVAKREHNEIVTSGGSYTDSFNVSMSLSWHINPCFPQTAYSTAYFFVKTNANGNVHEAANSNNNVTGSGAKVLVNPLVDHIVTTGSCPDTVTVARPYNTSWTVKNTGYNTGPSYYQFWYDAVFFSPDSIENNNDVLASQFFVSTKLERNQSYTETQNAIPPNIPAGDYYVYVKTNWLNYILGEKVITNNSNFIRNASGAAKKIHVVQPPLPELTDTIITAPLTAPAGQPMTVVHKITNTGAGPTYPGSWSNKLWLSGDFIPGNSGDVQLSAKNIATVLQPGQSMNDTMSFTLNINTVPGNYILIAQADAFNTVYEVNDTNNLAFSYVTVYTQQPVDLIVENVMKPDTVMLGYSIDTAKWVIANLSANTATGISSDGIYLSDNTILDSTAVLIGIKNKTINMPPLDRDTISMQPIVTSVIEGNYNVLIKTDLLNNINETDKNNNTGISAGSIYVKAKELKLNITENNTLHTLTRYYKLVIPDSLNGSTILVTLKTNDSLTMRNEMYIGLGYVPSPSHFDYRFGTANYGNQQIVMTTVTDSVYYIAVRCISPNPLVQNITLNAVKLPFAILNVQSNSGGNIGNVTVKLSGSLFTNNMVARLNNGGTVIYSSIVYFINSTTVFATFNLLGKPLGLYDVSLIKPDSAVATLPGGFTITTGNNGGILTGGGNNTGQTGSGTQPGCDPGTPGGLNSLLVTEVIVPEKVFVGWPFVIQINYANPANFDVPAQTRTLYNDKEVLMALTQAGLSNGTTSLYLELTEPGGPPGIIRAGATGTITVYGKTPPDMPGHTYINFTIK
ncbi:MAG TPA: CARDB domain-containing protein [Chitinophagaceae bacterium]|nr:CARDB domain-containing protein [Chitinophagaceae bacterium]